jgi:hypothetical protein
MKTSIALIVAETRRTVGWLARGAAAQVRPVLASGSNPVNVLSRLRPWWWPRSTLRAACPTPAAAVA